jgi:hypothetical protein
MPPLLLLDERRRQRIQVAPRPSWIFSIQRQRHQIA